MVFRSGRGIGPTMFRRQQGAVTRRPGGCRQSKGIGDMGISAEDESTMMGRRTGVRLIIAAATAGALTACTGQRVEPPAPAAPVSAQAPTDPGADGSGDDPLTLVSREDLVDPQPVVWHSWRLVDPSTIEVAFFSGVPECQGVHVDLRQTDQAVTINLSVGRLPHIPSSANCIEVALAAVTLIRLDRELGDREVRQDR